MNILIQNIYDFNQSQIENYKRNNTLQIKLGRIISENIFSLKLKNTLEFIKKFRSYKLSYSQGKIYKYKDYHFKSFNTKRSEIYKSELLEKTLIPYKNYDILIQNNLVKNLEIMPSKMEYNEEYEYDEICVYIDKNIILNFETYNDIFTIKIDIELEKDLPYTYQDVIKDNLEKIFNLLEEIECE